MKNCLNNAFEGKVIGIPGIEQDPNEFYFKFKSNFKDYIIGINLDYQKSHIIISIAFKNINNIVLRKLFTYEGIEKFDPVFFKPFNGNIFILFKFITRLLIVNLIDFETTKKGNINLYYLILNCIKDCSFRPIKIDLNDDDFEEIIIDRNLEDKNNNKTINIKMNYNNKNNHKYDIDIRKIELEYENSEIYKEIEIKFTNSKENKVYYKYLNFQDFLDLSAPYYQLFNNSIEDIFDDLYTIIIKNNNYYFEEHNQSIRFFYPVFNIKKITFDPYIFVFIKALNQEKTNYELQLKGEKYFQSKLNKEQYSEKIGNIEKISYGIDEQSEEKSKKENKKIKNEINNNSQISFMKNFLNMNKNLNLNNDENKNNNEIKNENDEQKIQRQSNNKYNNLEKNELINQKLIIKEKNIKNNIKNNFKSNLLEKEYVANKGDSNFMNQKRHRDSTLEMYFGKTEENKFPENKEVILNNNNIIKKSNNYSSKNIEIKPKKEKHDKKDKKESIKLNIDNFPKEGNKKSEDINMGFKLDENGRYNINIDKVKMIKLEQLKIRKGKNFIYAKYVINSLIVDIQLEIINGVLT